MREIILRALLDLRREEEIIERIEKFTKRTLSLAYKIIEKNFGEEEARKIIEDIKQTEK